jgi:hypothetical protein
MERVQADAHAGFRLAPHTIFERLRVFDGEFKRKD